MSSVDPICDFSGQRWSALGPWADAKTKWPANSSHSIARRRWRWHRWLATLTAAALIAGACGDGGRAARDSDTRAGSEGLEDSPAKPETPKATAAPGELERDPAEPAADTATEDVYVPLGMGYRFEWCGPVSDFWVELWEAKAELTAAREARSEAENVAEAARDDDLDYVEAADWLVAAEANETFAEARVLLAMHQVFRLLHIAREGGSNDHRVLLGGYGSFIQERMRIGTQRGRDAQVGGLAYEDPYDETLRVGLRLAGEKFELAAARVTIDELDRAARFESNLISNVDALWDDYRDQPLSGRKPFVDFALERLDRVEEDSELYASVQWYLDLLARFKRVFERKGGFFSESPFHGRNKGFVSTPEHVSDQLWYEFDPLAELAYHHVYATYALADEVAYAAYRRSLQESCDSVSSAS